MLKTKSREEKDWACGKELNIVMYDVVKREKNLRHKISSLQDWCWPANGQQAWSHDDPTDETGSVGDWLHFHSKIWFKYIKDYNLAIQAGGNGGVYPRMLAEKFKIVYTFEPTPILFHCLVNNNQLDNVIKIQAALGNHQNFVSVICSSSNPGANIITTEVEEGHINTIPMMTIDQFRFPVCDLIALDAEESEENILLGAEKTIKTHRPVVIIERGEREEIRKLMGLWGYAFREESGMDHIFTYGE